MPEAITGKIERKYMAHFLDSSFGKLTPNWVRLGKDLEEFTIDLSPDTETSKNILGETSFKHNGYEATSEAEPYYANTEDELFVPLQEIVDNRYTGDQCKTSSLEVHLWDGNEESGYTAWKQECYVVPTSYGGDTSGYQIPFTINYVGARTKGKYDPKTKAFTAE